MPSNFDLIKQAILERKQVVAEYDGYHREMCPHVMGWKHGIRHILSYQFAGDSSKGLPPDGDWKCMDVDGLSQLTLRDGEWHTRMTHGKPQTCVDQIEAEIAY